MMMLFPVFLGKGKVKVRLLVENLMLGRILWSALNAHCLV